MLPDHRHWLLLDSWLDRLWLPLVDFYSPLAILDWLPATLGLALACWLPLRLWPGFGRRLSRWSGPLSLVLGLLIVLGLWLPAIIQIQSASLGGQRYYWLSDDAMISMRYGRNLAAGHGLVWNPGQRVEGFSNLAWTLFMALVHLLPLSPAKTSLVILLANIALAALCLPLTGRLARQLDAPAPAVFFSTLALALSPILLANTATGLETPLLTLLCLLVLTRILEESRQSRISWLTYILIGLMTLVRADALVLAGLLWLLSLALNRDKPAVLRAGLLPLALVLSQIGFRLWYYGDLWPNTTYLKVLNWPGRYLTGLRYVLKFGQLAAWLLVLAAAGLALVRRRENRLLALLLLAFGGYVGYVGGDVFAYFRFFAPVWPCFLVLGFSGAAALAARAAYLRWVLLWLALLSLPLVLPGYREITDYLTSFAQGDRFNLELALLIKNNTPPYSKIAATAAGVIFYFSERPGVDLLGKCDRYIARRPVFPGSAKPGHNKFDYDYSLGALRPDFVVAAEFGPEASPELLRERLSGDLAFSGQFYFNPIFQEHFLPYPVRIATWRTLYVADWSDQLGRRFNWRPAFYSAPTGTSQSLSTSPGVSRGPAPCRPSQRTPCRSASTRQPPSPAKTSKTGRYFSQDRTTA